MITMLEALQANEMSQSRAADALSRLLGLFHSSLSQT